ncbi:MAG: SPOR domain-containing protein [Candidatus Omnitrophica bacterium]|nr:SPOR domain-containing protein [Candidatus Omnitrophota bacterium]
MVQGELFREESSSSGYGSSDLLRKKSFISRYQFVLTLDKFLIVLIGVTVVFVLTYSFGVEHGKRMMEKQFQKTIPIETASVLTTIIPTGKPSAVEPQGQEILLLAGEQQAHSESSRQEESGTGLKEMKTEPIRKKESDDLPFTVGTPQAKLMIAKGKLYTVQLVTYNNKQLAQREIERLKSKGFEGFVIPSGSYFQVCVNYFESRTKARDFLNGFSDSGRCPDAYIRPVVR